MKSDQVPLGVTDTFVSKLLLSSGVGWKALQKSQTMSGIPYLLCKEVRILERRVLIFRPVMHRTSQARRDYENSDDDYITLASSNRSIEYFVRDVDEL